MSLIDKAVKTSARPKSFWVLFVLCFAAPIIGLPYVLLVNNQLIPHATGGFLFFLGLIAVAFLLLVYYLVGMASGKYRDLEGQSWSELPW